MLLMEGVGVRSASGSQQLGVRGVTRQQAPQDQVPQVLHWRGNGDGLDTGPHTLAMAGVGAEEVGLLLPSLPTPPPRVTLPLQSQGGAGDLGQPAGGRAEGWGGGQEQQRSLCILLSSSTTQGEPLSRPSGVMGLLTLAKLLGHCGLTARARGTHRPPGLRRRVLP